MICSPAQLRAAWVIVLGIAAYGAVRLALNPRFISDPQPEVSDRAAELADRLDPNAADWRELAAIPDLGEKRARAIVAYREMHQPSVRGPLFQNAYDLMVVRGIGYATATKLKEYLVFPATKPATAAKSIPR